MAVRIEGCWTLFGDRSRYVSLEAGIRAIEEEGLFELCGDARIMQPLDALLNAFVEQKRMKLPTSAYNPCYRLVAEEEG